MHAFLSKIFGRRKDEKKDEETSPTALSPTQLLDGKFEAVSPTVSPSASKFLELDQGSSERDKGTSSAKAPTRPSSSANKSTKLDTLPHLSLNFGETRTEGFLLEDEIQGLSDSLIGERRLNPLEALILIRSCSQAITAHGLETLGLMHPHWYSSSPEIQRKLISQFLHSQSIKNANDTTTTTFDSALESTRSMHDVAAVLRWGLRHLQLDGDSFGTDAGWYKAFLDAEAAAEYPPKAFSEKLAPMIPITHLELLTTTLELFSSLAAHSEANSTSGSKLSKLFGIWLLTGRQIEDKDDWFSFYARWERTGRQLEHLFLARIRDTNEDERMPVRLLELVRKYPYTQGLSSPTTDLQLLPRPRLSTPIYDALFVRIEIEFPPSARTPKTKMHPLNLLADAFATKVTTGEYAELWNKITAASKNGDSPSPLSNIFADETIRFLSIVPDSNKGKEAKSPSFSLLQSPSSPSARSSASVEADIPAATQATTSHKKFATEPITPLTASAIGNNWEQFSSSGFLDSTPAIAPLVATLFDQDIEKTVPPEPSAALSRKSSWRVKAISRKSVDLSRSPPKDVTYFPAPTEAGPNEISPVVKAARLEIIQFDEAFIDFWTDSLLDPITAKWPTFIICKFKSTLVPSLTYGTASEENQQQKQLKWLVLEQVYTNAKPPPPIMLPTPDPTPMTSPVEQARAVSPSPSTRRRFNFWSMSRSTSSTSTGSANGKKKAPAGKVNEMGELVEEESAEQVKNKYVAQTTKEEPSKKVVARVPVPAEEIKDSSTVPVAAAAVAATAVATIAAAADAESFIPAEEDKTPTQEVIAPVQQEMTTSDAAIEATVPVSDTVDAVRLPAEGAVSPPLAPESEFAPTSIDSAVPPAADTAARESDEPEALATLVGPVQATVLSNAVLPIVEAEVRPKIEEAVATSIHSEPTGIPVIDSVPVVEASHTIEEVSAAPAADVETVSTPIVETEVTIPVVEAEHAEAAPPLIETELARTVEEPEATVPVTESADVPIVDAVSTVEAAPVIEKALPAPAYESESISLPVAEADTTNSVMESQEPGTLKADDSSSGPEEQYASHTVGGEVATFIEPETLSPPAPEQPSLTAAPAVEEEPALVPRAGTVETETLATPTIDIASPTFDPQSEGESDSLAVGIAALTSVAAAMALPTVEAEGTTPTDIDNSSLAHVEVETEVFSEPPASLVAKDEASPVELETETIPAVESEVSPLDAAVKAGDAIERDGAPSVDNGSIIHAVVEAEPLESEAATVPVAEAAIPHPITEAEATTLDTQAESSVASLEPEPTQVADEAAVVPTISDTNAIPPVVTTNASPALETETPLPIVTEAEVLHSSVTADSVHLVVEEGSSLQVSDNAVGPEAEEATVAPEPSSITIKDEEVPIVHQEVEVASAAQAESSVSASDENVAQETTSNAAHVETDVVPHVAEEHPVSLVKEDVDAVHSVEESVPPAIADESISPPQGIASVEQASLALSEAAEEATEAIIAPAGSGDADVHLPVVESESVLTVEGTETEAVPPPVESVTSIDGPEGNLIEAKSEDSPRAFTLQDVVLAPQVDSEMDHPVAESLNVVSSVESPAPSDVQASIPTDNVETVFEAVPVRAEEQPIEYTHPEVVSISAPSVEGTAEHANGTPADLAGGDNATSPDIASTSADQIDEERLIIIHDQAGLSEQSVTSEPVAEPTSDIPAVAGQDADGSQAHLKVADPEHVEDKEDGNVASTEPGEESSLEQADTPKAVDIVTEESVEAGESDPVLPPGLYPTAVQAESHSDTSPASEGVSSAEAVEAGDDALDPPKLQEVVEGGATSVDDTPGIRSASPTNEPPAGESATAPGESILAVSPPSPSPNEVSASTVIEQEAPILDITTAALDDPVSTLSAEASEEINAAPAVATPTKEEDDLNVAKIADGADAQTETTANHVDHIHDSAVDSQRASAVDFAEATDPSSFNTALVSSVHEPSEPEIVIDAGQKAEGTLTHNTQVESDNALGDEPVVELSRPTEAEHILEPVASLDVSSKPAVEEIEESVETAAAPVTTFVEEPVEERIADLPAESDLLDSSPAVISTETDATPQIVVPQPAADSAELASEAGDEAASEPVTVLSEQAEGAEGVQFLPFVAPESVTEEVSDLSDPVAESQTLAQHGVIAEVADSEAADVTAERATPSEDAPTDEEPTALESEHEIAQDNAVPDAPLSISSEEAHASAPLSEETVVDAQVEKPVAAAIAEPEVPVEASKSSIVDEEPVTTPEPVTVSEESAGDIAPSEETAEPAQVAAPAEPEAPAGIEAEADPIAPLGPTAISTESVDAETIGAEPTEAPSQVADRADEPAAADEPFAKHSVVDIADDEPSTAPPAMEAEDEHVHEPIESIVSVEEPSETAVPAEAHSCDSIEETTPIEEDSESPAPVEHEAPTATVVDEAISHDEAIHAGAEEPAHLEAVSLSAEEPPTPLEHVATRPTKDAATIIEGVDVPAEAADLQVEPFVESVVEGDAAVAPAAEAEPGSEPAESVAPIEEAIGPVEPAPTEEISDAEIVKDDLPSAEQAVAPPAEGVEAPSEVGAETTDASAVDAGNLPSLEPAEPEADHGASAPSEEPDRETDVVILTPEVAPAEEESAIVEEATAPAEDSSPPLEEPAETIEEPAVAEESVRVDEENIDQVSIPVVADAAEPVEHEDHAAVHEESSMPSEPVIPESIVTEPTDQGAEPLEESTASVEDVAVSQDSATAQGVVHDAVEPEQAIEQEEANVLVEASKQEDELAEVPMQEFDAPVDEVVPDPSPTEANAETVPESAVQDNLFVDSVDEELPVMHEESVLPEQATKQADANVDVPIQDVSAPVNEVLAAPEPSSNVVEPEADAAVVPESDVQQNILVEAVAPESAITQDAPASEGAPAAEEPSDEVAQETPEPENISAAHEESVDTDDAPIPAQGISPIVEITSEESVEVSPEETVEEASHVEIPITAHEESEAAEETALPSDESTLPVESSSEYVDEAAVIDTNLGEEQVAPIAALPEMLMEDHAIEQASVVEEVGAQTDESDAKPTDILDDGAPEQAPSEKEDGVSEQFSPAEDTPDVVDAKQAELAEPDAVDETTAHPAHSESAADVEEDKEDHPVLAERASEGAEVIDEAHVPIDAIAGVADENAPVQPVQDEGDSGQVVEVPVQESAALLSEYAEIPPPADIHVHALEDLSEQQVTADDAHAGPMEVEDASRGTTVAHQEEATLLTEPTSDVSEAVIDASVGPNDTVAHTSHDSTDESVSKEDPQQPIVDASTLELAGGDPIVPAHETAAADGLPAPEITEHSAEEAAVEDISSEAHTDQAAAIPPPEVLEAPLVESVAKDTPAEQLPAEDLIESTAISDAEPTHTAETPLKQDEEPEAAQVHGHIVADDVNISDEALDQTTEVLDQVHHSATDAPVEEDIAVEHVAPVPEDETHPVEDSSVPEVDNATTERAPATEAEAVDSEAHVATDAEPAGAKITEAPISEEEQDKEDNHAAEAVEPSDIAGATEAGASDELPRTTSELVNLNVEPAAEPAPTPVAEDDTVGEPSVVEPEVSAEFVPEPVEEGQARPTEVTEEPAAAEPVGSVVENDVAPAEDVAVLEAGKSMTTEHGADAQDIHASPIADADPIEFSPAEAPVPQTETTAEEEETAVQPAAAPAVDDEVFEPLAEGNVETSAHTPEAEEHVPAARSEHGFAADIVDSTTEEAPQAEALDYNAATVAEPAEAKSTEPHLPEIVVPSGEEEAAAEPIEPVDQDEVFIPPTAQENAAAEVPAHAIEAEKEVAAPVEPDAGSGVADSTEEAPDVSLTDASVAHDPEAAEASAPEALVAEEGKHDQDNAEHHESAAVAETKPDPSEEAASAAVEPEAEDVQEETSAEAIPAPVAEESEVVPDQAVSAHDAIPATVEPIPEGDTVDATLAADTLSWDQEEQVPEVHESSDNTQADVSDEAGPIPTVVLIAVDEETTELPVAPEREDDPPSKAIETAAEPEVPNAEDLIEEEAPAEPTGEDLVVGEQADVVQEEGTLAVETDTIAHESALVEADAEEEKHEVIVEAPPLATTTKSVEVEAAGADAEPTSHSVDTVPVVEEAVVEATAAPDPEAQTPPSEVVVVPGHIADSEIVDADTTAVAEQEKVDEPSTHEPAATEEISEASDLAPAITEPVTPPTEATVEELTVTVQDDEEAVPRPADSASEFEIAKEVTALDDASTEVQGPDIEHTEAFEGDALTSPEAGSVQDGPTEATTAATAEPTGEASKEVVFDPSPSEATEAPVTSVETELVEAPTDNVTEDPASAPVEVHHVDIVEQEPPVLSEEHPDTDDVETALAAQPPESAAEEKPAEHFVLQTSATEALPSHNIPAETAEISSAQEDREAHESAPAVEAASAPDEVGAEVEEEQPVVLPAASVSQEEVIVHSEDVSPAAETEIDQRPQSAAVAETADTIQQEQVFEPVATATTLVDQSEASESLEAQAEPKVKDEPSITSDAVVEEAEPEVASLEGPEFENMNVQEDIAAVASVPEQVVEELHEQAPAIPADAGSDSMEAASDAHIGKDEIQQSPEEPSKEAPVAPEPQSVNKDGEADIWPVAASATELSAPIPDEPEVTDDTEHKVLAKEAVEYRPAVQEDPPADSPVDKWVDEAVVTAPIEPAVVELSKISSTVHEPAVHAEPVISPDKTHLDEGFAGNADVIAPDALTGEDDSAAEQVEEVTTTAEHSNEPTAARELYAEDSGVDTSAHEHADMACAAEVEQELQRFATTAAVEEPVEAAAPTAPVDEAAVEVAEHAASIKSEPGTLAEPVAPLLETPAIYTPEAVEDTEAYAKPIALPIEPAEGTTTGDLPSEAVDAAQDSDVLIGNGNGHHTQIDKLDVGHGESESSALLDELDDVDEESFTATMNGNGHLKAETETTLVEPTSPPFVEQGKLDKILAHVNEGKPMPDEAEQSLIQDDSAVPTGSVLTKVEDLLITAGSILDAKSISDSLPLPTITHDESATKLTTTTVNDSDEE